MRSARCGARPDSPRSRSSRSRWASAPTAPSSASSMASCSRRCRSTTPIACIACARSIPTAPHISLSAPDFASMREMNRVFDSVEAYSAGLFTLLGAGDPKEVRGAMVSDGYFGVLGLPTAIGRGFLPEENQPGRNRVIVLDHGFWQREFGGDRGVLGRTVVVGGNRYSIVGVLAAGRRLPAEADMYAPLEYGPTFSAAAANGRRSEFLSVFGRARAGVTAAQIEDDMRRVGTGAADHVSRLERPSDVHLDVTAAGHARRRAPAAVRAARRGRLRAAGGLRQRRQPAAGARVGTPGGSRRSRRARRRPLAAGAAVPDRVDGARRRRRRPRSGHRVLGDRRAGGGEAGGHSAARRSRPERHRRVVHAGADAGDQRRLRVAAGAAGGGRTARPGIEERRPQRRRRGSPGSRGDRGGGDGACRRAADRGRPAGAQLRPVDARRSGVCDRARDGVPRQLPGGVVSATPSRSGTGSPSSRRGCGRFPA